MARMAVYAMPRAPRAGWEGILASEAGVIRESLGLEGQLTVRRGRCLE